MRKFIIIAIPIITIALFILIMLSGNYLKKPILGNDDFPGLVQNVIEDVNLENWEKAEEHKKELDNAWKNIVKRVQFSSEREEINALNVSLARVNGAILVRNKALAVCELKEAYEHWDLLGN